jgi:transposase
LVAYVIEQRADSVAAHLLEASGRAMLRALVSGERDTQRSAELARRRLRNKIPLLIEALQ